MSKNDKQKAQATNTSAAILRHEASQLGILIVYYLDRETEYKTLRGYVNAFKDNPQKIIESAKKSIAFWQSEKDRRAKEFAKMGKDRNPAADALGYVKIKYEYAQRNAEILQMFCDENEETQR